MGMGRKSSAGGKRTGTTGGNHRSAKTGRYVTVKAGKKSPATTEAVHSPSGRGAAGTTVLEKTSVTGKTITAKVKRAGKGMARQIATHDFGLSVGFDRVVTMDRPLRVKRSYTKAQEQAVVRLATDAQLARHDPGEDLTGLSDEEFMARLFR